jgi:hypothetical protein
VRALWCIKYKECKRYAKSPRAQCSTSFADVMSTHEQPVPRFPY